MGATLETYRTMGKYDLALAQYDKVAEMLPFYSSGLWGRGETYLMPKKVSTTWRWRNSPRQSSCIHSRNGAIAAGLTHIEHRAKYDLATRRL